MCLVVIFREEMHVVCSDDACAEFIRQVKSRFGDIGVVVLVALDFDEVSFGAEDFEVSFGDRLRRLYISARQLHSQFTLEAGRCRNQNPR